MKYYLHPLLDGLLADVGRPLGVVVVEIILALVSVSGLVAAVVALVLLLLLATLAAFLLPLGQRRAGGLQVLLRRVLNQHRPTISYLW